MGELVICRFTRETFAHEDDVVHHEGDVVDLDEASVLRWERRGAVEVIDPGAAAVAGEVEYTDLTVKELRAEAERRELDVSALRLKAELVSALEDNDAAGD